MHKYKCLNVWENGCSVGQLRLEVNIVIVPTLGQGCDPTPSRGVQVSCLVHE